MREGGGWRDESKGGWESGGYRDRMMEMSGPQVVVKQQSWKGSLNISFENGLAIYMFQLSPGRLIAIIR